VLEKNQFFVKIVFSFFGVPMSTPPVGVYASSKYRVSKFVFHFLLAGAGMWPGQQDALPSGIHFP
jgi:hypothetical protein